MYSIQKQPAHTDAASTQCCPTEQCQRIIFVTASMTQKLREPWHRRPFTLAKHFGFVHLWPWTQQRVEAPVSPQTLLNKCLETGLAAHNRSSHCRDVLRHIDTNFPTGWLQVLSSHHPSPFFWQLLWKPVKAVISFLLLKATWTCMCFHQKHITSSEMKKISIKVYSQPSFKINHLSIHNFWAWEAVAKPS